MSTKQKDRFSPDFYKALLYHNINVILFIVEKNLTEEKQISAVTRAFHVLETLAKYNTINLETLSKKTALPKTTLMRFLSTLIQQGYVYRDPEDQYALTLKMFSIGSHSLEYTDFHRLAKNAADEVVEKLGETVHVGVIENDFVVYILKVQPKDNVICLQSRVGRSNPVYCTAVGKIILAHMEETECEKLLEKTDFVPFTPNTLTNKQELKAELEQIRANGWAMDREELEKGVICISAPIYNYTQNVIAGFSVSWPVFRFDHKKQQYYIDSITQIAARISGLLGYLPS